jgi:adenylate cyclase
VAKEIERKFLVVSNGWKDLASQVPYRQGYLSSVKERVVRVRTVADQGTLTIKGITVGMTRCEYEYPISLKDAEEMLDNLCLRPLIEKKRSRIAIGEFTWEVDEFFGENQGLVVAEVELKNERQQVPLPDWIGQEVTEDPRYQNSNLAEHPYSSWRK